MENKSELVQGIARMPGNSDYILCMLFSKNFSAGSLQNQGAHQRYQ